MKISKVNHIKTAVSVNGDSQKGILYADPALKGKSVQNIREHIERRSDAAKRLYNIFNQPKEIPDRFKRNDYKKIVSDGNYISRKITKEGRFDVKALKPVIRQDGNNRPSEETIAEAVKLYVRKSLSGASCLRSIEQMLLFRYGYISWNDIDITLMQEFLDTLKNDFDKTSQKPLFERSITNQNLVVQPETMLGGPVIQLSGSEKKPEKEGLNRFLFEYARLSEADRKSLRVKLRRLLILYFYGEEQVPEEDFDEWGDHVARKTGGDCFVNAPEAPDGNDRLKERIYLKELNSRIRDENIKRYRDSMSAARRDGKGLYFKDMETNAFWIHHMESAVERILKNMHADTMFKLELGYLGEKVWKDMINYLSIKYIATGKAVYNFAMGGLGGQSEKINLLEIPAVHAKGISSFEYEIIKADETIQRETAVYVLFAANHLACNTAEKIDDFFNMSQVKFKDNVRKNILQFFGGHLHGPVSILKKDIVVSGRDIQIRI